MYLKKVEVTVITPAVGPPASADVQHQGPSRDQSMIFVNI